ncbi:uncharacterized protein VP01_3701g2, partial [Puccinia sorghi]
TKRSGAILALKSHRKLCLTGTPLQNHLGKLYTLLRFLGVDLGVGKKCGKHSSRKKHPTQSAEGNQVASKTPGHSFIEEVKIRGSHITCEKRTNKLVDPRHFDIPQQATTWWDSPKIVHLVSDLNIHLASDQNGKTAKAVVLSQWTEFLNIVGVALRHEGIDFEQLDGGKGPFRNSQNCITEIIRYFIEGSIEVNMMEVC